MSFDLSELPQSQVKWPNNIEPRWVIDLTMNKKEEAWANERKILTDRLTAVENKLEKNEKEIRRNNSIIVGKKFPEENCKQNIEAFIESELQVKVSVKQAYKMKTDKTNPPMYMVEWSSWNDKSLVMRNKKKTEKQSRKNIHR